ncbi:Hybrid non-ribosomal peptide synthetase/type I polyketide synthase [Oopsacas minuta]|uniref:Hybrid non-ribosomal peptide synthetase/type I polyketide synthase n=1 Tax=Oopsacas minuta TaxID=111878 RepID=A0AAV7JGK1_9METZ|nr:Hybrid non-ribosomal peptide synthetase/type I polyketide synthase [Oopsacas minuta]
MESTADHPYQEMLDLLNEQFNRNSSGMAVISANSSIHTYSELQGNAGKIRELLLHIGVARQHVIGICIEQNFDYISAVTGVMLHGSIFLNLDQYMNRNILTKLISAQPPDVLIIDQYFPIEILSEVEISFPIIFIESILYDSIISAPKLVINTSSSEFDRDVMYLVYTSGSTGGSNCVMGSYTALLNRFCWEWQQFPFSPGDLLCCQTSPAFTDFLWTSLGGLLVGTPTIIVPKPLYMRISRFIDILSSHSVSHLVLVPSILKKINKILGSSGKPLPSLKFLVSTGEILYEFIANEFLNFVPNCTLLNFYGSTEVTSDVTFYVVHSDCISTADEHQKVSIGRAITGVTCHIIDDKSDCVKEPYVVGELVVTGDCLSHGYYKNPELTKRKFCPLFLSPSEGAVEGLRTGDLASWLPNGDLEFVGRLDDQVKISGSRCDLKEIEIVINKIAFIDRVVVRAVNSPKQDPTLVAYVQLDRISTRSVPNDPPFWKDTNRQKQIHSLVAKTLPPYMTPTIYIFVKEFQLLNSGKVDSKSLPDPMLKNWEVEATTCTRIDNDVIEFVKGLFAKHLYLEISEITLKDNFMELGGYSLLVMSLFEDVEAKYNVCMPVFEFIEDSTVQNLCEFIQTNMKCQQQQQQQQHQEMNNQLTLVLPENLPEKIPFSFAQKELYYLHEADKSKSTYNEFVAVEIEGLIEVPLLQTAINDIITSRMILRTTFHLEKQEFYQKIHTDLNYKLQILQTSNAQLDQDIIRNLQHEFTLDQLPLFQFTLFILCDASRPKSFSKRIKGKMILLLSLHHLLVDGLSLYKILLELFTIYNTYLDTSAKLPGQNPPQYISFVLLERSDCHQKVFKSQLEYWRTQLHAMDMLHIRSDMEGSSKFGPAGQFICGISLDTKRKLTDVALAHNTSLFTTLIAAFAFLLSKYAQDQDDVTIATPMSLRPHIPQGMELIGPLINVVLIRTKFGILKPLTQHSFSDLLTKMHETVKQAMQNSLVPLEHVANSLRIDTPNNSPFEDLLQALFVFHEHSKVLKLISSNNDYSIKEYGVYPELNMQAKSNIVMSIDIVEEGLQARLAYRTSLFSKSFARQFCQDYVQLLQFISNRPTSILSRFSLLSNQEYKNIISICSTPNLPITTTSIPQIFYKWVQDTPNNIALEIEDRLYTYSHLYELITLIVQSLTEPPHQHGCVIGICMRQSVNLVASILAALFAGFGYVYLDPDLPKGRLTYIQQDANISTVLLDSSIELSLITSNQIINIDIILNSEFNAEYNCPMSGNEICYILYTSGSTGRPKGVIVGQINVITRCCLTPELIGPPAARYCQFSTFSFDIYAYEFYCALLNGATLCIFERVKYLAQLDLFTSLLHRQYIDCMMLAPPLCDVISKNYPRAFSSLYSLMVSGDILQPIVSNRILTQGAPKNFYNLHGITEVTVVDSIYRLDDLFYSDIPIGRPLTNNSMFVVDKHMNLLPKGIVGEILVGGGTVALGYLNNSEKTKDKFVTFRFSQDSTTRLFKSGDLGYLDFSDRFRFIGRSDWQIKLRGQRLELGEIERVALEYPGVNEFAAVCRIEGNIPVSIIGFCSTNIVNNNALTQELNLHLRDTLAPYMIPSEIYFLNEMPYGTTGKIDRQKLMKLVEEVEISSEKVPSKNAVTSTNIDIFATLKTIFTQYFPEIEISINSDFFNIGGNSITALQLVSQINSELQLSISLREFFQHSTVAKLAKFITDKYNFVVQVENENYSENIRSDLSMNEISKRLTKKFPNLSNSNLETELLNTEISSKIIEGINTLFCLKLLSKDLRNILTFDNLCSLIVEQLNFQEIPSENPEVYPLASTQRQFALAYVLNQSESAYHIPLCIYSNQLEWDIVTEFFNSFIQNHSILRTVYTLSTGFSQKLISNPIFPFQILKFTLPPEYIENPLEYNQLKNLIKSEVNSPLDIQNSIPLRATFVDINTENSPVKKSLIILILHHIAADGWSVNLLLEEFQNFIKTYPKYKLKNTNFLQLTSNDDTSYIEYWKNNLSKFICNELKSFMLLSNRSNSTLEKPDIYKYIVEIDIAKKIQKTSQICGVTPFITFLSAFVYLFTFLYEPSLQIVVLTPVSTRSTLVDKQYFGPSVNLLPIAIDLESKDLAREFSFNDLTKFIQNIFHTALENSPITYEEIHPFLNKSSSNNTKVPVVFSYDSNQLQTSLDLGKYGKAQVLPAFDYLPTLLHDILIEVNYTGVLIEQTLTISQAGIQPEKSKNILTQYNILLESVCDSFDTPLYKLTALPDVYAKALTGAKCPSEYINIVILVYKICMENPDDIAFEFDNEHLTYKQFFAECYTYAIDLRKSLPNPSNTIIAIIMDLSIELILAMISVLIIDFTYILIDPILPINRIQAMLEFTETIAIITTNKYKTFCEEINSKSRFISVLDRETLTCIDVPYSHDFHLTNETAYVMSTSGSTGEPRYVTIPHSSILSRIHVKSLPFYSPTQTVLICSSLSFDILPLQIYGSIFSASKGVIIHQNCLGINIDKLKPTVIEKNINHMTLPTPVLHLVIEIMPEIFEHVKYIDFGGDVASPDILCKLQKMYPKLLLTNSYGPTEATIVCSSSILTLQDCLKPILTIGSAVPNTDLLIVDTYMRSVPFGIPGELLITGGVMSGYLHRPNDERLVSIENALGNVNVYFRTGDKVQQREDGKLEFLGRNDFQVKLDGQRVELSEIEHALMKHKDVQLAIVFVKKREKSNVKILLACILCENVITRESMEIHAKKYLTTVMVPSQFYFFKTFPLSINGKVDRTKLFEKIQFEKDSKKPESIQTTNFVSQNLLEEICQCWKQVLGLDEIPLTQSFHTLGGTSLLLVQLHYKLQQKFEVNLSLPEILTNNTVWLQSNWIASKSRDDVTEVPMDKTELILPREVTENARYPQLAVIGMACRFPMSEDKESFHDTLLQGKDCIDMQQADGYIAAGGCLSNPELFDADYFDITRFDACLMDPQYRLLLELAVDVIRDAAISLEKEKVGVFIGCATNTYLSASGVDLSSYHYDPAVSFHVGRVLSEESAANFISYHLNLTGPSLLVKTTCVSSLTAMHLAAHSLHTGECTAAIVGGVDISFPQISTVRIQQDMIFSPTGHCKSFDDTADGLVSGNGIGLQVITLLHNALSNGYPIYCKVTASSMNNDGNSKDTYFSPSLYNLTDCIKHCINLDTEGYIASIEAHGAGTMVGDQIELEALHRAYSKNSNSEIHINLGSVKSNIGHLGYASGAAALCKSILQLEKGVLYPSLHFSDWNGSYIKNHGNIPFRVASKVEPWTGRRRSAVNGMGQGGTNVHIILEEHIHTPYIPRDVVRSDNGFICPISAHSDVVLKCVCRELMGLIERRSNVGLPSLISSLYNTTRNLSFRKCFVSPNQFDLLSQLKQWDSTQQIMAHSKDPSNLVLIFAGQGAHFPNMGLGLYLDSQIFRSHFDNAVSICRSELKFDLLNLLFSANPNTNPTHLQVYTVCLQVCLYRLMTSIDIDPVVLIGHSIGEISVATCCNVFTLEDAIQLVYYRSRLMLGATDMKYGMLAVKTDQISARKLATESGLSIAAFNSPNQTVLSGEMVIISSLCEQLTKQSIQYKVLSVPTAYHSKLLTSILPQYRNLLKKYPPHAPSKQYISTVTGNWVDINTVSTVSYWEDQLVNSVLFYPALECAAQIANPVFLEIGPGSRLSSIIRNHMLGYHVFPPLITSNDNYLETFKEIWEFGFELKWSLFGFFEDSTPKIRIFPFPFERKKFSVQDIKKILKPNVEILQPKQTFTLPLLTNTIPEFSLKTIDQQLSAPIVQLIKNVSSKVIEGEHKNFNITVGLGLPGGSTVFESLTNFPTSSTTIYPIGCLSSIFIYILFNIFLTTGRVTHSTKLIELLPLEYSISEPKSSITLFHLATHSSGLAFLPSRLTWEVSDLSNYSLSELFTDFVECELQSSPGDQYSYSVFGSALLTHALTAITEQSYEELLQSYILQPLEMKSTFISASIRTLKFKHYQGHDVKGSKVPKWNCGEAFKFADGVHSTLKDLISLTQYLTGIATCDVPLKGVLDFMIKSDQNSYSFLSGITNGSSVWLAVDLKWKTSIILACNTSLDNCKKLAKLTEFTFNTFPGLYTSLYSSNIIGGSQSIPMSFGEKQILALGGGSMPAINAPINALAMCDRSQEIECPAPGNNYLVNGGIGEILPKNEVSDVEKVILEALSNLVGGDVIKRQDVLNLDFTHLGLDSLLAISLAEQISNVFNRKISFHLLSEYTTIHELSQFIQADWENLAKHIPNVHSNTHDADTNHILSIPNTNIYELFPDSTFPLVIEPASEQYNGIVNLKRIFSKHSETFQSLLLGSGALLFRNFKLDTAEHFSEFTNELSGVFGPSLEYLDGISPRTRVLEKIYTSTEYPSKYDMSPHNEMSYSPNPPSHIMFFCLNPPNNDCGGQTPLMSSRNILDKIPEKLLKDWKTRSLKYYWNLSSRGKGAGKSWQDTYGTEDRRCVEKFLAEQGFEFKWKGSTLRTSRTATITRCHPITKEEVWFNHALLFHPSELPDTVSTSLSSFPKDEYPKHCTYGNGEEISDSDIAQVKSVCLSNLVMFDWQKGDVLLVDNFLVAHARKKFSGERKILVSMFRCQD